MPVAAPTTTERFKDSGTAPAGADGAPTNIHVLRSLREDLDANAIAAVTQWRFTPAVRQGTAVPVEAKIEANFKLL